MIDIHKLLRGLTQTIRGADFPDTTSLASALDLDISEAKITKMKFGNTIISGAHLSGSSIVIDVVCGVTPWREIWILFDNASIPYRDVTDEIFGADQRIIPSKLSPGFGVLFEIDGWTCGFTASSPDGDVDSLFCEEPKQTLAGGRRRETFYRNR
ncbi:MAG: hypothetical protein ACYC5H_12255 [Methylovirgula sp.]